MFDLSNEELLYLLYTFSHLREEGKSTKGTATKGTVKKALLRDNKGLPEKKIESAYTSLLKKELIEAGRNSQILITSNGIDSLISGLSATNYRFESDKKKVFKVLNGVLNCFNKAGQSEFRFYEIDFEEFSKNFKELYFEEKKRQEIKGVVAISKQDIYRLFQQDKGLNVNRETWEEYFNKLKSLEKISISKGEEDDLIHWVD
ncbi:MAG: hypothetical protein SFY66_25785 [Oculatellaceae cyanobacterium bins.114]|nr:hypothetical protein [Oculatellaceae cyanobacterium bins.114]